MLCAYRKIVAPTTLLLITLAFWQGGIGMGLWDSALFPSPFMVLRALGEALRSGALLSNALASLERVIGGFFLASIVAVPAGLLLGTSRLLRDAMTPMIGFLRTVSPIAWIPLAILWFGLGNASVLFIIFMAAFFPVVVATARAVMHIDPLLVRVAQNFGASRRIILFRVILPAIVPAIATGLRISLGISWMIVVAAEMVGMNSGLGFMILDARNFLRIDLVIAAMIAIGIIGYILDCGITLLEKKFLFRWGFGGDY